MRALLTWTCAAIVLLASGCSKSTTETVPTTKGVGTPQQLSGALDVVAFQGGYGIDFYEQAAKEFAEKHPQLQIKVSGNPRVWEQLRPRFVGDDPPDLTYPGWGMDHWALAEEGQLLDLTGALETKVADGATWGSTFDPKILALGRLEGKQFVLPYFYNVMGWWYDPGLFAKHGWKPPKNFTELLLLCKNIKSAGIAPITYQGKYPYYMIDGMLLPWAYSVGGADTVRDAQNLKPGAWKSAAMLQAATMIDDLNKAGFFQAGATGMSHTESQQEFLQGKAAMIPCGTWLFSEMKNVMPESAKMEFMLPPVTSGGSGEPTSVMISIEPWMVPSKAKNPDAAIAFYQYMTSLPKAKEFVEQKGTLMAIIGSDQAKLPEVLVIPARAMRESKDVWAVQYRQWYPAFNTEIENALTSLLNKEVSPLQFCERVEAAAEKTRNDSAITKHKL